MLILQRKTGQSFVIGDDIEITIQEISGGRVRISVDAPKNVQILRKELLEAKNENHSAAEEIGSPMQLLELLKSEYK